MTETLTDARLLERFADSREEEAFATLVRRHGPRVLSACRRVLPCEHDAEDVVQATFLLLAQKAGAIAWEGSVGGWLCGVARRLALHARSRTHCRRETSVGVLVKSGNKSQAGFPEGLHPSADALSEILERDLKRIIHAELCELPEKYRAPVELCDLQGMTHEEAARTLGWPAGSMSRRLGTARALLRQRLADRGLSATFLILVALVIGWELAHLGHRSGKAKLAPLAGARSGHADASGVELGQFIRRLALENGGPRSAGDLAHAAGAVEKLATALEGAEPVHDHTVWLAATADLRESSAALARAVEADRPEAMTLAAVRIQEACVRCHLASRD